MHVLTNCLSQPAVDLRIKLGLLQSSSSSVMISPTDVFPKYAREFKACYSKFHLCEDFFISCEIDDAKAFKEHKGQIGKALKISDDAIEWYVKEAMKVKERGQSLEGSRLAAAATAGPVKHEAVKKFFDQDIQKELKNMIKSSLPMASGRGGDDVLEASAPSSSSQAVALAGASAAAPHSDDPSVQEVSEVIVDDEYLKRARRRRLRSGREPLSVVRLFVVRAISRCHGAECHRDSHDFASHHHSFVWGRMGTRSASKGKERILIRRTCLDCCSTVYDVRGNYNKSQNSYTN